MKLPTDDEMMQLRYHIPASDKYRDIYDRMMSVVVDKRTSISEVKCEVCPIKQRMKKEGKEPGNDEL